MGTVLSLILGISLFIRGFGISSVPPELFGDEIDVGYQAYSLLKTGQDLYGQILPAYIHSLSEWRAPLLMYYTVPSIAVFGNTEIGVRAPEIILGTLAVLILFLLTYQTTRSKSISLLTSLTLALVPWHFQYSRAAFEVVLLLDLLLLASLLFIKKQYSWSAIFFGLTFYAYSTASVFTPLLLTVLYLLYKPKFNLRSSLLFLLILVPFMGQLIFGKAGERFSTVSVFSHPRITEESVEIRTASKSPVENYLTNRPFLVTRRIMDNYLSAFSTEFLFVRGDPTIRHNTNFTGQLLPVMAIPLAAGIYWLAKKRQFLWLLWLVIAPLPASLTYDGGYHATRLFVLIPPLCVAIGAGFKLIFQSRFRFMLGVPLILLLSLQLFQFFNYYFYRYPENSWKWWHTGYKQAMTSIAKLDPAYSRVYINNTYEPSLIRFLFYTNYSPAKFHQNFTLDQPQPDVAPNYFGFFLPPKYYFGAFSLPPNKSLPDLVTDDSLYLISQRDDAWGNWQKNPPGGIKVLDTITDPFNDPILYLITRSP